MASVAQRDTDVVVVGAGVIGLACGAALARAGHRVVVVERHARIGTETTSRNSEVIHAGIYYPTGSLKAELCIAGREALVARCEARRIPYRLTGKLVVATAPGEVAALEALLARGTANGASRLAMIDAREVTRREPAVVAEAALVSPGTGIVDAAALCLDLAAEAEAHGALLVLGSEVESLAPVSYGWRIAARGADGSLSELDCGAVVNAAGLASDALAELAGIDLAASGYRLRLCKGDYFALAPGADLALSQLVYPVPAGAGLGIHATLDLSGAVRFGPDAVYCEAIDYAVDPAKAAHFADNARRFLPALRTEWLTPAYAGVRPKLSGPGEAFRDFVVAEESAAGCPGLVSCIGVESPGLTASPAIADRVVALLAGL